MGKQRVTYDEGLGVMRRGEAIAFLVVPHETHDIRGLDTFTIKTTYVPSAIVLLDDGGYATIPVDKLRWTTG